MPETSGCKPVNLGGGMLLLTAPLANPGALLATGSGMITIAAASLGLALHRIKAAMPYWILAAGSALTGVAGLFSGNWLGFANCFFSALGGYRLGCIIRQASQHKD